MVASVVPLLWQAVHPTIYQVFYLHFHCPLLCDSSPACRVGIMLLFLNLGITAFDSLLQRDQNSAGCFHFCFYRRPQPNSVLPILNVRINGKLRSVTQRTYMCLTSFLTLGKQLQLNLSSKWLPLCLFIPMLCLLWSSGIKGAAR